MAILTTGGDARADAGDRDASLRRAGLARGRRVGGTQPTRADPVTRWHFLHMR